jgi:hypothetical protein
MVAFGTISTYLILIMSAEIGPEFLAIQDPARTSDSEPSKFSEIQDVILDIVFPLELALVQVLTAAFLVSLQVGSVRQP